MKNTQPSTTTKAKKKTTKNTLSFIIKKVLEENGYGYDEDDANARRLYRGFEKLIVKLGGDKNDLKKEKNFEFEEGDIFIIKAILKQLLNQEGPIWKFMGSKTDDESFNTREVYDFIQTILNEAEKDGYTEYELKNMADFFDNIYRLSPLRATANCHLLIACLLSNLHNLTSSQQTIYLNNLVTGL